jgi:hypothetical protein
MLRLLNGLIGPTWKQRFTYLGGAGVFVWFGVSLVDEMNKDDQRGYEKNPRGPEPNPLSAQQAAPYCLAIWTVLYSYARLIKAAYARFRR